MAFNTYIGDVIAIFNLGEEIWRLGWSDRTRIEPVYTSFYESAKDWDLTAKRLQVVVAHVSQQEDIRSDGHQLSSFPYATVFDKEQFLKAINDQKKLIKDCFALLRHTASYLPRTGAFWQLKFNLEEASKFEDLTRQITSQTARLSNLLKPLELSLLLDTNRKVNHLLHFAAQEKDTQYIVPSSDGFVYQQKQPQVLSHAILQDNPQVESQKSKCVESVTEVPSPDEGHDEADQGLQLLWKPDGTIQLEITTYEKYEGQPTCVEYRSIELNAKTTRLIPLYACPTRDAVLSLRIFDGQMATDIQFSKLKHLLRFQHAATGYEVYDAYSQGPIDVNLRFTSPKSSIDRKAFVQFWIPKRLEEKEAATILSEARISAAYPRRASTWTKSPRLSISSSGGSTSVSSILEKDSIEAGNIATEAPISPSSTSPPSFSPLTRNYSENSQSSLSSTLMSTDQAYPSDWKVGYQFAGGRRTSKATISGLGKSPAMYRRQSAHEGANIQAQPRTYKESQRPMVVFLMHDTSSSLRGDNYSILTVEVDRETRLNTTKCDCKTRDRGNCPHITIEKSTNSDLLAQKYEMSSLEDWDITLPGMKKRKNYASDDFSSTLRCVNITFAEPGDPAGPAMSRRFGGYDCKCRYKTMADKKKCLVARHQGNFGIVKEIVENQARDHFMARSKQGHFQFGGGI
ncbi:uncharacterized protein PV09_00795 [Verruconis gallopava]|uniref:Uncharacterized protein n=1 Tax=Verruconis gallopava TaxID=253628 RepID=A0A0D1Y1C1_9PEZI|nr:uncharacterized protein PV09_00795 [Verruconis gallopava]KIW08871.1 hypothetical protein PV09_00795 [Verruconis gallopava]